jgi:uncharacterized membrane protein YqaE (UPF0057 family)
VLTDQRLPAPRGRATVRRMTMLDIILAVLLPPVAVWRRNGFTGQVLIALVLWLLGHIPGAVYALYVLSRPGAVV